MVTRYQSHKVNAMKYGPFGFNGQCLDPVSGSYFLGNGYRAYNPVLSRFNCPDSWSPFGAGGINRYAYCGGDPVNQIDPSGHVNWTAILSVATGVIGLASAAVSFGMSIAAAGGVMLALNTASVLSLSVGSLAVGADVAAIESGVAALAVQGKLSTALGWLSLGLGIAAGIGGVARAAIKRAAVLTPKDIGLNAVHRINLHPPEAGPVQYYKAFSIEPHYRSDSTFIKYNIAGFISDIKGTGEPGLVLHGFSGKNLRIGYTPGFSTFSDYGGTRGLMFKSAERFTGHILDAFNIDLKTVGEGSLHLLACYSGGKNGFAQKLANYLSRPVISYASESEVLTFNPMKILGNDSANIRINRSENAINIYSPAKPERFIPDL